MLDWSRCTCRRLSSFGLAILLSASVLAQQGADPVQILQARGVDQRVDYRALEKFGPWDDRNYQLTTGDLSYLSPDEAKLHNQLPAFFRVELRKEWPHLRKSGPAQYPRAALQLFGIRYGGLMQNGKIKHDRRKRAKEPVPVGREIPLNAVLGANEITVEINPANPQRVIAGSNNAGGQEMYYSADGGATWTIQGVLPNTCCDPTVDWSSDGSVAYVAALSSPDIGVSFWRSIDQGVTWVNRVDLTSGGSDKEFIHVDKSATSPYQDNIYVTYHNGNTMQFARSTNLGFTFNITAFGGAPTGIGSDITTTSNGDIYYAYGAFGTQTIELLKSTDGGSTFNAPVSVASTNGSFDFPIPSMESRNAWIYAATDADRSGGPFDGSVYVSWTDTIGPESGTAANNHTRVNVAYSRDGGATWAVTTPHSTADELTVDRFNQWMTVDEFGNVHVVFYDTRNSLNRTGVDLYYANSVDGGVTWSVPERVSTMTSANLTDGQEWGDYNGISVLGSKIISTWTDNRDGPPNMKDVYADEAVNLVAEPGFMLGANPASFDVCAPAQLDDITVSVGSLLGFTNPVTLSYANLPAGITGNFSVNPVTPAAPPATSLAQLTVGSVAQGNYPFDIAGAATGVDDIMVPINVSVFDSLPGSATLSTPLDAATGVSTAPVLTWIALPGASNYTVELDDDPAFGSIDFTTTTTETSIVPAISLSSDTTYSWRVRAENPCGAGVDSAVFSFTTIAEICSSPSVAIPDGSSAVSDSLVIAAGGTLADLDVSLDIGHTWVGDLIVTLTHQSTGTSSVLLDRPGLPLINASFGCGNDNIDAILDDAAATAAEDQCSATPPAIGGTHTPNNPLSVFNGESTLGTWTLTVSDNASADTGVLTEWCLLPSLADPDFDGDGVPNSADNCTLVANSLQIDTNGDGIGNRCDADINNDCIVNPIDLGLLGAAFFATPVSPNWNTDADFDGDARVNIVDLGIMRSTFFTPPGPSAIGSCP